MLSRHPALLLLALGICGEAPPAAPQPRREVRSERTPIELPGGSRIEFHTLDSPALKGAGEYSVFLPPSYGKGARDYAVVYFLHGLFNDHTSWTVTQSGVLPPRLEELMRDGKIPELVMVHPNGERSFYTNYRDGRLNHEDFVVRDLVTHVEATYRVKKTRAGRAIAGTSMGGHGALKIALKYPDRYAAVAAHSPIIFLGKNPLDVPPEMRASPRFQFLSEMFASIYGEPIDQAYYDANNILLLARKPGLDGLAIYFDYGTADRYISTIQLDQGVKALDRTLSEAGVAHAFKEHSGEPHGWQLVARHLEDSLRFISQRF